MGSCVVVSSIIHALVFEDRILDYEEVIGIAKQYDERIVPFIDLAYYEGLILCAWMMKTSMGYTLRTLGLPYGLIGMQPRIRRVSRRLFYREEMRIPMQQ